MKKEYFKGSRTGSSVEIKMNTNKLEDICATLMSKYVTRVGVLGSKTERKERTMTNAAIGLIHEKGSVSQNIPRRSFLELPLVLKSDELKETKKSLEPVFKTTDSLAVRKSLWKRAYKLLGIAAEDIIQRAFESRGFGHWTINPKTGRGSLIDTGQLRRSITSDVKEK